MGWMSTAMLSKSVVQCPVPSDVTSMPTQSSLPVVSTSTLNVVLGGAVPETVFAAGSTESMVSVTNVRSFVNVPSDTEMNMPGTRFTPASNWKQPSPSVGDVPLFSTLPPGPVLITTVTEDPGAKPHPEAL